jgi:hypothetical protein
MGRRQMQKTATLTILALAAAGFGIAAVSDACAQTAPGASEVSTPSRPPARARTRITVSPAYPYRTYSTTYPTPYKYEAPGPGYVRQCASWLAKDYRPSGTVIMPGMRCWWQPGSEYARSRY